jgi:hypothetical protein
MPSLSGMSWVVGSAGGTNQSVATNAKPADHRDHVWLF